MALKFGTSGVRGLVTEMTDLECYLYTRAFLQYLKSKVPAQTVSLAGDFRASTPRILRAVSSALKAEDLQADYCGMISTAAVTYHAMQHGNASIMVTGSHIPDDRNGIKFNMPWGEVLKGDEAEISSLYHQERETSPPGHPQFTESGRFATGLSPELPDLNENAEATYVQRYLDFFAVDALKGMRVVVYQHSSVSRDSLCEILEGLGAEVIRVGRSDSFVPVDTEAVQDVPKLANWISEHGANALASTDGDGDRPLLFDETGRQVRGDLLGILVAEFLGAQSVSVPVSCNSGVERSQYFQNVSRTRIGSPFVISSMKEALRQGYRTVVGYEANGGFLTASDIVSRDTGKVLRALPTRDAALPITAALRRQVLTGQTLSQQLHELPPAFTHSGLIREFPRVLGHAIVSALEKGGPDLVAHYFRESFGAPQALDFTDGARITFASREIVHLRPSGNAPEFRCYTEAASEDVAAENNRKALGIIQNVIRPSLEKGGIEDKR